MAVEVSIKNTSRMTFEPLVAAVENKELIAGLERSLSRIYSLAIDLATPLTLFTSLNGDQVTLAHHYSRKLNHVYQTQIEGADIEQLIEQAQKHIQKDYRSFLADCISKMEDRLRVLERGVSC